MFMDISLVNYTNDVKCGIHELSYTRHMNTLGERIAHVIKSYQGNQTDLGKAVGVSRGAVSQWKVGEAKNIKAENLFPLARVTGFSPEWIATGKGPQRTLGELSCDEIDLITNYRQCEDIGRSLIMNAAKTTASFTDQSEN